MIKLRLIFLILMTTLLLSACSNNDELLDDASPGQEKDFNISSSENLSQVVVLYYQDTTVFHMDKDSLTISNITVYYLNGNPIQNLGVYPDSSDNFGYVEGLIDTKAVELVNDINDRVVCSISCEIYGFVPQVSFTLTDGVRTANIEISSFGTTGRILSVVDSGNPFEFNINFDDSPELLSIYNEIITYYNSIVYK